LGGGPIQVNEDGTPYRSYLYAADLAIWLLTILFRGMVCQPYNTGSDALIQILDLAKHIAEIINPKQKVRAVSQKSDRIASDRYVPSIDKALRELSLKPRINLSESVKKLYLGTMTNYSFKVR